VGFGVDHDNGRERAAAQAGNGFNSEKPVFGCSAQFDAKLSAYSVRDIFRTDYVARRTETNLDNIFSDRFEAELSVKSDNAHDLGHK